MRRAGAAALAVLVLLAGAGSSGAAPGLGDAYYPSYGNGGYDVAHYEVHVRMGLRSGLLTGHTFLTVTATQDLSSFQLDLVLPTDRVLVDGEPARFTRPDRHEVRVVPARAIG